MGVTGGSRCATVPALLILRIIIENQGPVFNMETGDIQIPNSLHQFMGKRRFVLGRFSEGDANGVANTHQQQSTDARRRLHATFPVVTRLGDTEMQRISQITLQHTVVKQFGSLHHRQHIARLHREDQLVEIVLLADVQPFEGGLHHCFRCVAVAADDTVA